MRKTLSLLTVTLVVFAAGVWWYANRGASSPQHSGGSVPMEPLSSSSSRPAEPRILYWFDPMKPDLHFDKPGKSPFMDMELQPKYAEAAAVTTTVRVAPQMVQALGLRTAVVTR